MSRIVPIFNEFLACPDLHLGLSKGSALNTQGLDSNTTGLGIIISTLSYPFCQTHIFSHIFLNNRVFGHFKQLLLKNKEKLIN